MWLQPQALRGAGGREVQGPWPRTTSPLRGQSQQLRVGAHISENKDSEASLTTHFLNPPPGERRLCVPAAILELQALMHHQLKAATIMHEKKPQIIGFH